MSLDTRTKLAIYRYFAETGQRPSLQIVAERVHADISSVREAYVRLRTQRVLVLEPDGVSIRMAPPFSCGRSSRWTSYGRSRRLGIRRAYKRTRGVRSPMRCVPFSLGSA